MPNMLLKENFSAGKVHIEVTGKQAEQHLILDFRITTEHDCALHWGLSKRQDPVWHAPPASCWPEQTTPFDAHAAQTTCRAEGEHRCTIRITLDLPCPWDSLPFVLYFPAEDQWLRNDRQDFRIRIPCGGKVISPQQALAQQTPEGDWQRREFDLGGGDSLAAAVLQDPEQTRLLLVCDIAAPLALHWGLAGKFRHQWQLPPSDLRPAGTTVFDNRAVRTPFTEREGLCWLELDLPLGHAQKAPRGINFVLYQPATGQWFKANGRDMYLPLQVQTGEHGPFSSERVRELADRIIDAEMHAGSWTLMHRFNLCYDLLDGVEEDTDALALLFAWLRYSAIRQLDWQRNYNTKPRELSHAQERLTLRLAGIYNRQTQGQPWVRLMLGTLGRGGEGQKVRDEILNIMHRHHIKEVHGRFLEEWHQKLHNNTTPDDVAICEGYLAFLHSNGDLKQFYDTLSRRGVGRERLRSFERPIRTDPEFYADKRDGLSRDFEYFLHILKSVHSGTDLDTAAGAARGVLDDELNRRLDALYDQRRAGAPLHDQVQTVTSLREGLAGRILHQGDARAVREMLYLDLALEQVLRGTIEGQHVADTNLKGLTELAWMVLRNLSLEGESGEFQLCARHLRALLDIFQSDREWALHAKSVTERAGRGVAHWSETLFTRLQPKAEYLGEAFEVDAWTIPLFSEEIIRGGAGFLYSLLLRRLDPLLRRQAGIGGWQVISPAHALGRVRVVDSLRSIQGERFTGPTVLIADAVAGDEEIPPGVTSVITSDSPDLVSHVAVRARNVQLLFATCYDADRYHRLKELQGRQLALDVSPAGDVEFQETNGVAPSVPRQPAAPTVRQRTFSSWVVTAERFDKQILGGKSNNLQALRGRVSEWIRFPTSIALPFGVFEKTLASPENRDLEQRLATLLEQASEAPASHLPRVRQLLQGLNAPTALREALLASWRKAGLPQTEWEMIWQGVKKVWASKWNERAWYSRTARGINHQDLMMAVLIQEVIEADYAFVIHTVNPLNGRDDELFAEVVLGLGETLVGNYPGRALGVVCRKSDLGLTLLSYPGKSVGLYGGGVIFRSDSNGEDLERFAGAGLYDSFLAEPPQERLLDYTSEPLVWDSGFRTAMLRKIARIALEVEQASGSAQDIEGAVQHGDFFVVQTRPQVGL